MSCDMLDDLVRSVGDEPNPEALKEMWLKLKAIVENLGGNTTPKKQKVEQTMEQVSYKTNLIDINIVAN